MNKLKSMIDKEKRYHINAYSRLPVSFIRGKGSNLWDVEGKEYLDFIAGLGVVGVGHCHPKVARAVKNQMEKLVHVSNLFYIEPQIELAEILHELSFEGKCFFANSGAEVNEGAVKLTRKYAKENFGKGKYEIITALNSFHGRTFKMLAATGQPQKQKPFEPLPPGFKHVPLNDLGALEESISEKTCGVMLEPIQGEGGIYSCNKDYLKGVARLCHRKNLVLIMDEIQTGLGRTGKLFCYEHYEIEPDIITLAKSLGNGLPIGAFIAKAQLASAFGPGDHGSTFGGGPVVTAAAIATLEVIAEEGLVKHSARRGKYFFEKLQKLKEKNSAIAELRGKGLMVGVELKEGIAKELVQKMLDRGVVINNIGANIIRFLPPLIITEEEIDRAVEELDKAIGSM